MKWTLVFDLDSTVTVWNTAIQTHVLKGMELNGKQLSKMGKKQRSHGSKQMFLKVRMSVARESQQM